MPDKTLIRQRLAAMAAATVAPTLDDDALDRALANAAAMDAEGRAPSDPGWAGAWDLNAAAAAAWREKAGLCSARFAFGTDGQSFQRQQVFDQCMRMAEWYDDKAGSVIAADGSPVAGGSMTVRTRTLYTSGESWTTGSELIP